MVQVWGSGAVRFFFLFEIESEKKEQDADGFVGSPLEETPEQAGMLKISCRDNLDAVVPDDLPQFFFHQGCKFVVAHIHIQFYAGIGADPVDVIRAVGHPDAVIGGHFAV